MCGDELDIYSGNDDQIIPIMALGAKGVISVLSNVAPKETHEIAMLCYENKYAKAREKMFKYQQLAKDLFCDVNPIPVKHALNAMGFKAGPCRMPLYEMSDANKAKLEGTMKKVGLIK